MTVRLFYGLCLFELVQVLADFPQLSAAKGMNPLWLVSWVPLVGAEQSAALLFFGATFLAALLTIAPQTRWARVGFLPLLTMMGGYLNSFGKIDHNWHAAIVVAFFLCFLPAGTPAALRKSFSTTRAFIVPVALAISGFMLCYSISGFWKVSVGLYQLTVGEVNAFHPHALAYHVTRRLSQNHSTASPLALFLIEAPWLGWLPYLLTLYGEFFAVFASFRVRSHRVFGLILLSFHIGSALTLGIGFFHHQLLLLVMMVASPLCPTDLTLRETLESLPLIGAAVRRFGPPPVG